MPSSYDIAVIGSGFAGSLIAMIARRLGHSVVLIEKGRHPRVVIGESSTPLTNLLLEELAIRYNLPAIKPLAKWGTWQQTHPEISCGLKRGFSFYHHDLSQGSLAAPDRSRQLLVAASPNDAIADTHWFRADFDHFFVQQAERIGVDYFDEVSLAQPVQSSGETILEGHRHNRSLSFSVKLLIDASGPRGFLHRGLKLKEAALPSFPATQAIFSHFTEVERLDSTTFGTNREPPPYPIDDAAVHHLFDGGWVWVLRFNNGITSAGVAAIDKVAVELNFSRPEHAWHKLLERIPALREQFTKARPTQPFTHIPRLAYRTSAVAGSNWAMLPSAAGFIDPLLSTGFPLALLGVARLAKIIEKDWGSNQLQTKLQTYDHHTQADLLAAAQLIAALYANMHDFPVFRALSLIYFAAVSYAETVRRLQKPESAGSFLLRDHPAFGPCIQEVFRRAQLPRSAKESAQLIEDILRTIQPFNIAGLADPAREHWYPVYPADLFQSASKLASTPDEIAQMLHRCGITAPPDYGGVQG